MSQRPFAVFDIDGTLIRWQLYHSVVSELGKRGLISEEAVSAINAARMTWKRRTHTESFREYERVLVQTHDGALPHIPVNDYLAAIENVFQTYRDQTYVYTRDLIRELKSKDYLLFAISGSQQEIIERLAAYYGFDDAVGTLFERAGNRFTGQVSGALGRKAELLQGLIRKHDAAWQGSIGVGDSDGDVSFLELVEKPIAFNPSTQLFEIAAARGWEVVVERKNVTYQLQPRQDGYGVRVNT